MSFLLLKRYLEYEIELLENKVNHTKQTKNGRGKKDYILKIEPLNTKSD